MGNCALCGKSKADKKNTHYLTDYIIRSALNQDGIDGSKNREKGAYFDLTTGIPEFKFQRNTSPEKIKEIIGRQPTDGEIEDSKENIEYSKDNIFCSKCEERFTKIENDFKPICNNFRNGNYVNKEKIVFSDQKDILKVKLFFILQLWRTAVCDANFIVDDETMKCMKDAIDDPTLEKICKVPISVSYLTTKGDNKEYTGNIVGHNTLEKGPSVIFMNDFVIQLYSVNSDFRYENLYGINDENTYCDFIHSKNSDFKIKNISNEGRKKINKAIFKRKYQERLILRRIEFLKNCWMSLHG